jgi:protein-tyrosine phosphatase
MDPGWNTSEGRVRIVTDSAPHLLFVCTANIVRSPIAAALLETRLRETAPEVVVESAGLRETDATLDDGALAVLDRYGVDLRRHNSRAIDSAMVGAATLILGLEREHVREAVLLDPSVWPRTFTLKEVVRRGEATGARAHNESIEDWIARAHAGRTPHDLLGADPSDDVADPYGGAPGDYEDAAAEIDHLVGRLVLLIWLRDGPSVVTT